MAKSQYVVTEKHYISQFGFVKSRFLIKDVTAIELDSDTKKLTVFVGEQYMVLSIVPEQNDAFVQAMREMNKKIDFSFTLAPAAKDADKKNWPVKMNTPRSERVFCLFSYIIRRILQYKEDYDISRRNLNRSRSRKNRGS